MKYIKTFDMEVYPPKSENKIPLLQCDLATGVVEFIDDDLRDSVEYVDSKQVHESDYYETIIRMSMERDDIRCVFQEEGFSAEIPGIISFTYILTPKTAIVTLYGYDQESMFNYGDFFKKTAPSDRSVMIAAGIIN